MKKPTLRLLVLAAGIATLATGLTLAHESKGKTRPMKTSQLMKGLIKPHSGDLKKGLEAAPANDEAWEALGVHAALLNEASYTLMDDGRCPDAIWADAATKLLRQGSADLLKAIEAKDHAAAKTAFGMVGKSCKACHDEHKHD